MCILKRPLYILQRVLHIPTTTLRAHSLSFDILVMLHLCKVAHTLALRFISRSPLLLATSVPLTVYSLQADAFDFSSSNDSVVRVL